MKILHVADFLPGIHERVGGAEFVAQRIIAEQAKIGLDIEIATLPSDNSIATPPWNKHYEYGHLDQYARKAAYAVKQLYFPNDPIAFRALTNILKKSKPDIVHYHNLHFSGLSVLKCAKAAGIPSLKSIYDYWIFCPSNMLLTTDKKICTIGHGKHCVDCVGARRMRAIKPLKAMFFGLRPHTFGKLVKNVDQFVVLSNASKDLLIHHNIESHKINVIPQYIWKEAADSESISQPIPGRIVYVGWVEERKGLHIVIEAFIRLAKKIPELHIEVLGLPANQDYQAKILALIKKAGLDKRVNFRGKLPREDLLTELQKAFLIAIPEQWENMSPVILTESMAAGVCPLASRVGGIKHFVQENVNGILAERNNVTEWAEKIQFAMDNPGKIKSMAVAARIRAMDIFNPTTINQNMLTIYRKMLKQEVEEENS